MSNEVKTNRSHCSKQEKHQGEAQKGGEKFTPTSLQFKTDTTCFIINCIFKSKKCRDSSQNLLSSKLNRFEPQTIKNNLLVVEWLTGALQLIAGEDQTLLAFQLQMNQSASTDALQLLSGENQALLVERGSLLK